MEWCCGSFVEGLFWGGVMEFSVLEFFVELELDIFLFISFWKNFLVLLNFVLVGFEGCRGLVIVGEVCFFFVFVIWFLRLVKLFFKVEKLWCSVKWFWLVNGMDGMLWLVCILEMLMLLLDFWFMSVWMLFGILLRMNFLVVVVWICLKNSICK